MEHWEEEDCQLINCISNQRPGFWLPGDSRIQQAWFGKIAQHVTANPKELHPTVAELKDLIENNTRIFLLASGMYQDMPDNYPDPGGQSVRSYTQMLQVMNQLLTVAPVWGEHENEIGLVGLPMLALIDWPLGTFYGLGFFLDPQVNAIPKKILNVWGDFFRFTAPANVFDSSTLS